MTVLAIPCAACRGSEPGVARTVPGPSRPVEAQRSPTTEAGWGRYHSNRFQLSFPLPDGKTWRIDDHSRPELVALQEATQSRLEIVTTQEDELVNRATCEARARATGWVTSKTLTTVDDQALKGPDAYDSRVWVSVDAGRAGGALDGHVYVFGAFLRRCLILHFATTVASARGESVLSERLALARTRIVSGLVFDALRVTGGATVPRAAPSSRRD